MIFLIYGISLGLSFATAFTGARFRPGPWYQTLRKPLGLPPPWVFPVVWTLLYLLMAIAAAQIFLLPDSASRSLALLLYVLQLVANAAWSWIFFGRRQMLWAWADLSLLVLLVLADTLLFYRLLPLAGVLMLPYLLWLGVAFYLNGSVWWLNRRSGSILP
ncbi:TspO/MBR family protein [Acidithiobacillus sp. IBUN Pt1247-S3]|uniref:TspO/MBR family protein n=1 Tax=Acidithiobacillus sp. IBUN Pt1247-S3 TaxID=3166642 RepID=UPI0034E4883C